MDRDGRCGVILSLEQPEQFALIFSERERVLFPERLSQRIALSEPEQLAILVALFFAEQLTLCLPVGRFFGLLEPEQLAVGVTIELPLLVSLKLSVILAEPDHPSGRGRALRDNRVVFGQ